MVEWTMENHEYKGIRNEIELVIKEFGLDRSRVSEVSKIAYASILRNVEKKFVLHGRQLHWSNMGLPDGYEYGGKLTEEQIKYAYINGTEYYFDKHRENLYDFYVYQECGTPVDDENVDNTKRQWAYVRWSLKE